MLVYYLEGSNRKKNTQVIRTFTKFNIIKRAFSYLHAACANKRSKKKPSHGSLSAYPSRLCIFQLIDPRAHFRHLRNNDLSKKYTTKSMGNSITTQFPKEPPTNVHGNFRIPEAGGQKENLKLSGLLGQFKPKKSEICKNQ